MTIRERIENLEREHLSVYAMRSAESAGRAVFEQPDPVRTDYQRDRDRVIHQCRAFRRLAHKTQVFIAPHEDHLRTRLSHTLEVSQVARTIAKALRLNEELTEAIALGHDVGHTPFGHSGETALDEAVRSYGVPPLPPPEGGGDEAGGFNHYEHSLRVVDELERDGSGLNLTVETRMGIVQHSKGEADLAEVLGEGSARRATVPVAPGERDARPTRDHITLEAMVIRLSDRIAYLNHDLDDCLRAGVLVQEDVPAEILRVVGHRHSQRVGRMVTDVIDSSLDLRTGASAARVSMSAEMIEAVDALRRFMFERVYYRPELMDEVKRVRGIVRGLFDLYMADDAALFEATGSVPEDRQRRVRAVTDYVAGMTDRFARAQYIKYFLPSGYPF